MDWIVALATGIAVLRLCLICGGMWVLLRSTSRPGIVLDYQRKCFTAAGVIYLLGLMPQSLLLLLVNSNLANVVLDSGYLCWVQNAACMIAVALHTVVFLKWIVDEVLSREKEQVTYLGTLFQHKLLGSFLIVYSLFLIMCRNFFLQGAESDYYAQIAAQPDVALDSQWTTSAVQNPSQVMRIQLLLCECSLADGKMMDYLIISYLFLLLPVPMLFFLLIQCMRKGSTPPKESEEDANNNEEQQQHHQAWWEQEINIQRLLSTSICLWFHLIQPIIFSIHTEHFVDFGSHLLLTICVFIPWTHSDAEYNPLNNWV